MKAFFNLAKANLALGIRNPILNSVLVCYFITLPPPTLGIPFADINFLSVEPFIVCNIKVSNAAIRLKPWMNYQ